LRQFRLAGQNVRNTRVNLVRSGVKIRAEPYDVSFVIDRTAVMVIDMQNDFCREGGVGTLFGFDVSRTSNRAIEPARIALLAARDAGLRVIHTREGHRADLSDAPKVKLERFSRLSKTGEGIGSKTAKGRILVRGTWNNEIIDELTPLPDEIVVDKPQASAFYQTDLEAVLTNMGLETLVFVGFATNVCVLATIIDAFQRGYRNILLSDACASFIPELHEACLKNVRYIFGFTSTTEEFIKSLAKS